MASKGDIHLEEASGQEARPQPGQGVAASPPKSHFTLVFEGDLRSFNRNPHQTDTPFGRPIIAGMGNAFAEFDDFCDVRDGLLEALVNLDTLLDFEEWAETGGGIDGPEDFSLLRQRLLEARAAIAKAEGLAQ